MKKTNFVLTCCQQVGKKCGFCTGRSLLSKTIFVFALFLLPTLMFAQNKESNNIKVKQELLQAKQDAQFGNKPEVMQAKQNVSISKEDMLQQADIDRLVEKLGVSKEKDQWLSQGLSETQILAELQLLMTDLDTRSSQTEYRLSGGSQLCADATPIACHQGPVSGDTFGANNSGVVLCNFATNGEGVWYQMVGNGANNTIAFTAASFSTRVFVYSATNGDCNTLQCATDGTTTATWFAPFGDTFYIYVTGNGLGEGTYSIELTTAGTCDGPVGDGLSSATAFPIACGDVDSGNTADYLGNEVGPTCFFNSSGTRGVWYTFSADASFPAGTGVTVALCGVNTLDSEIHVYESLALNCVNDGTEDDDCGNDPSVDFDAQPGVDYYIYISHWNSATTTGTYNIAVTCDGVAPPPPPQVPANDLCLNAIELLCNTTTDGSNILATDTGEPDDLGCSGSISGTAVGVWYYYEGNGDYLTISTCGFDTEIFVFESASLNCGPFICVTDDDDTTVSSCTATTNESQVDFQTTAGTFYYVYVVGFGSNEGNFSLTTTCDTPLSVPDNDLCADAEPLVCNSIVEGNTTLANADGASSDCSFSDGDNPGVWYTYEGDGQIVTLALCGSPFDSKIAVFTGSCGALDCLIVEDDDFTNCGGNDPSIDFNSAVGTTYYVYVYGFNNQVGAFTLEVTCVPDPCLEADLIACGETASGTTTGGSTAGPTGFCGTTAGPTGVFYQYIGTDEFVTASLCGSSYDTKINIYEGSCDDLTCLTGNDDSCGSRSESTFFAAAGTSYYIWISGFGSSTGSYELTMTCTPPEENDLCEDAIALGCDVTVSGSTTLSTRRDAPEQDCDGEFGDELGSGVWYTVQGTGGEIVASTCSDADFDTKIAIFTGECGDLTCYAGDDDTSGCSGFTSEVTFATEAGETYYIYVTGFGSAATADTGNFNLTIDCLCVPSVLGTECVTVYEGWDGASTQTLTGSLDFASGTVTYVWNTGATTQSITVDAADGTAMYSVVMTDATGCTGSQEFFVYSVDIDCDRGNSEKIEICHNGNTICVSVNAAQSHLNHGDSLGACGTELCDEITPICDSAITSPANGSTDVSATTNFAWSAATGLVDGYTLSIGTTAGADDVLSADVGDVLAYNLLFALDYSATYYATVTPYNGNGSGIGCTSSFFKVEDDPCALVPTVTCGQTVTGTTVGATVDNTVPDCNTDLTQGAGSVIYKFVGTGDNITASLCGSGYDTKIGIFTGTCEALVCVVGQDDNAAACGPGFRSEIEFASTAGTEYYILITGFNGAEGAYELVLSCEDPLAGVIQVPCGTTYNDTYCYETNEETEWVFASSNGSAITIDFNAGDVEVWASQGSTWDDLRIYDGANAAGPILYDSDVDGGALAGVSVTASSGTMYMFLDSDGSVSCANSAAIDPWDFDVTCSGAPRLVADLDWNMYPNPSKGRVNLDLVDFVNNNINVQVIDLAGNVILTKSVRNLQDPKLEIELRNVPYGMYFVRVQSNDTVSTKKLIINN